MERISKEINRFQSLIRSSRIPPGSVLGDDPPAGEAGANKDQSEHSRKPPDSVLGEALLASPVGQIFLAAALLRILLAPFFFHPDIKTIFYNSQFLSQGIINVYDYLAINPEKAFLGQFVYSPLAYFFFGTIFPLIRILAGSDFTRWLAMGNDAVAVPHIFRYLFLMKLPLFVFEFLVGWILIKILKESKEKLIALLFWFFNPVNLYVVVMMGQFDVIPAFLTILALFWALEAKKPSWAAVALGIGGAVKSYPLLFLPFLVVSLGKNWRQKAKLTILGLLPYIAIVFPFLRSVPFRQSALISGLNQRILLLGLNIGFEEQIMVVVLILVGLFLFADWKKDDQGKKLAGYFLSAPLILLAGSHFHPQWFIWAMPFLAIFVAKDNKLILSVVMLIIGWLGTVLLFDDKFLSFGLLSPLDPGILFLPPPRELLIPVIQPSIIQSLFHTIFSASAIWISYLVVAKKYYEKR